MKPRLYIDVDDVIIANCYEGSGFDLRPGVLTQLRVLSRLFDCYWLTCWPRKNIYALIKSLYGSSLNKNMKYANWAHDHPKRKAGYVLDPKNPQNFWWLEDPLCDEEISALEEQDKLNRYISVMYRGTWGFLDAVNELFYRTGIDETRLKHVGAKIEWFNKEAIINEKINSLQDALSMVKLISGVDNLNAEARLKEIRTYVNNKLNTLY